MSKTQYVSLIAIVAFYLLLTATLLLRACYGYLQTKWRRTVPGPVTVKGRLNLTRGRGWTGRRVAGKLAH